jgi:predicted aspartyl protease
MVVLKPKKVSFKIIKSNHLLLKVKVNQQNAWFILDTGASNSCFASEFVAHFNLQIQKSETIAASASHTNIATELSTNNELKIGRWKNENISFVILDLTSVNTALSAIIKHPIHGILGSDILSSHQAVIDFPNHCLYLK